MDHLQSSSMTRPGPPGLFHLWGSLPGVGDKGRPDNGVHWEVAADACVCVCVCVCVRAHTLPTYTQTHADIAACPQPWPRSRQGRDVRLAGEWEGLGGSTLISLPVLGRCSDIFLKNWLWA